MTTLFAPVLHLELDTLLFGRSLEDVPGFVTSLLIVLVFFVLLRLDIVFEKLHLDVLIGAKDRFTSLLMRSAECCLTSRLRGDAYRLGHICRRDLVL